MGVPVIPVVVVAVTYLLDSLNCTVKEIVGLTKGRKAPGLSSELGLSMSATENST